MTLKEIYHLAQISPSYEGFIERVTKLELSQDNTKFDLTQETLLEIVMKVTGLKLHEIKSKSREPEYVQARYAFFNLVNKHLFGSSKCKAAKMVNKSHSDFHAALNEADYEPIKRIINLSEKIIEKNLIK